MLFCVMAFLKQIFALSTVLKRFFFSCWCIQFSQLTNSVAHFIKFFTLFQVFLLFCIDQNLGSIIFQCYQLKCCLSKETLLPFVISGLITTSFKKKTFGKQFFFSGSVIRLFPCIPSFTYHQRLVANMLKKTDLILFI